ncbi:hypothetical protein SARC_14891 [Sphaeroforma arctica JP610]|uniref:Uncharacterized protein n=1 Tax=Sphaeroforma arctica JP610 TaxID=667725 RepID=A0A0L0F7C3_9EUKA|nr:hypothetical protein SARC_14891 [Sphaeroforma arctica JP610]KNC72549.1 hypothetical protein SARC_14891 [Sphaeroforma arctica JP610]|eukprot:XP_014146451.1 hypothetical protein SARC_14891 [Sphaeroforma arctica JP610]
MMDIIGSDNVDDTSGPETADTVAEEEHSLSSKMSKTKRDPIVMEKNESNNNNRYTKKSDQLLSEYTSSCSDSDPGTGDEEVEGGQDSNSSGYEEEEFLQQNPNVSAHHSGTGLAEQIHKSVPPKMVKPKSMPQHNSFKKPFRPLERVRDNNPPRYSSPYSRPPNVYNKMYRTHHDNHQYRRRQNNAGSSYISSLSSRIMGGR